MSYISQSNEEKVSGLFVGNALCFSDALLNVTRSELGMLGFARAACLNELFFMTDERAVGMRLIVVEQVMLSELLDRLQALRQKCPYAMIALAYSDPAIARKLLDVQNGAFQETAVGVLPMNVQIDCWLSMLRLLANGERFMPGELLTSSQPAAPAPPVTAQIAPMSHPEPATVTGPTSASEPVSGPAATGLPEIHLTDREVQVLRAAAAGKQNKIIASELNLSQHTVKLHMHHIISKLGVHNRTEAAIWFMERYQTHHGA